ncbi:MAG: hypothetical protein H8E24_09435 [Verrucomicrobia bacterium]|jgi:hypothetical protein|nr:hypothetical protein [Verrucomicrobiota bacterium]
MEKLGGGGIRVGNFGGVDGGPPEGGCESWAWATSHAPNANPKNVRILIPLLIVI